LLYISRCRQTCEVASFKNFENSLTAVKVMTKTKVAPFYLGHGVHVHCVMLLTHGCNVACDAINYKSQKIFT